LIRRPGSPEWIAGSLVSPEAQDAAEGQNPLTSMVCSPKTGPA
jgi:hypothetical protein